MLLESIITSLKIVIQTGSPPQTSSVVPASGYTHSKSPPKTPPNANKMNAVDDQTRSRNEKQNLLLVASASLTVLLLDPAKLLLDIHALHLRETSRVLGRIRLSVI